MSAPDDTKAPDETAVPVDPRAVSLRAQADALDPPSASPTVPTVPEVRPRDMTREQYDAFRRERDARHYRHAEAGTLRAEAERLERVQARKHALALTAAAMVPTELPEKHATALALTPMSNAAASKRPADMASAEYQAWRAARDGGR